MALAVCCLIFGVIVGVYSCFKISLVILGSLPLTVVGLYFSTQAGEIVNNFCTTSLNAHY
jgi:multidrug efflux pump subunit AcrB